jgi:hypothetical protein
MRHCSRPEPSEGSSLPSWWICVPPRTGGQQRRARARAWGRGPRSGAAANAPRLEPSRRGPLEAGRFHRGRGSARFRVWGLGERVCAERCRADVQTQRPRRAQHGRRADARARGRAGRRAGGSGFLRDALDDGVERPCGAGRVARPGGRGRGRAVERQKVPHDRNVDSLRPKIQASAPPVSAARQGASGAARRRTRAAAAGSAAAAGEPGGLRRTGRKAVRIGPRGRGRVWCLQAPELQRARVPLQLRERVPLQLELWEHRRRPEDRDAQRGGREQPVGGPEAVAAARARASAGRDRAGGAPASLARPPPARGGAREGGASEGRGGGDGKQG